MTRPDVVRRPAAALLRRAALPCALLGLASAAGAQQADPRVGLRAGWMDAAQAISNLELVSHSPRPAGWFNPQSMGDFGYANSDLAFRGDLVFQGSFNGVQIWDISNPASPALRGSIVCPGGQGDVSVHGDLLFMSVEETRGRVDCGTSGVNAPSSPDRFRGVRIFDISSLEAPRQVAAVQTCRGSHTHTLVTDPRDSSHVFVYVQGTSPVRPADELAGCSGRPPAEDSTTALFRIEVIEVPLAAPQDARIVNAPRIFADSTGNIAGLWRGGAHGANTQASAETDQCHDITAYPEIGLAAGACSGNGILLDISDPANPRRIDEVIDPNFAYWHSATFDNEGSTVLFTDEWGGGTQPRCQASDREEWGANALFTLQDRELELASYYKLPAAQTATENCVAHNGSLIPIPGRDVMVQAWYQGGISVFDWTDPKRPYEIAFFDRGPVDSARQGSGGAWSTYWYNGAIYSSEISRGFDVMELTPTEHLTQNEIDAAKTVRMDYFNAQGQPKLTWPPSFALARAYADQLERNRCLSAGRLNAVRSTLANAERAQPVQRRESLLAEATRLESDASASCDAPKARKLAQSLRDLAGVTP